MHFQIFVPEARGQDPKMLIDVGLADFVEGAEFMEVPIGPRDETGEAKPGVVVAWRRPGQAQMGFQPDKQKWIKAVPRDGLGTARYWIGFWADSPATAADLARPYPQVGRRLQLGDGGEWIIPAAKQLDSNMVLADDGTWKFEVQRRFHRFYLDYMKWLSFFGTGEWQKGFSYSDAADFILSGLRINYRLPVEAASYLRLFSTENITRSLFGVMSIGEEILPRDA